VIALIPARSGSVSIPEKNIKPLAGRPLIDWVIKPASYIASTIVAAFSAVAVVVVVALA